MVRNRVKRITGILLTNSLLALVLVACGGDGPVTVAPPPSQPLEVALGESRQRITLMITDDSGFTLNGKPIPSPATFIASSRNYTRITADGVWTAAFDPMMIEVPLGTSGDSVTTGQLVLGGYSLNGDATTADTTSTASNDTTYGATLGDDGLRMAVYVPTLVTVMLGMHPGEWTAELIKPRSVLRLGQSGMTVTLIQDEAMARWIDPETPVAHGDFHTVGASDYTLALADGVWTATCAPRMLEVKLGMNGESVVLPADGAYA